MKHFGVAARFCHAGNGGVTTKSCHARVSGVTGLSPGSDGPFGKALWNINHFGVAARSCHAGNGGVTISPVTPGQVAWQVRVLRATFCAVIRPKESALRSLGFRVRVRLFGPVRQHSAKQYRNLQEINHTMPTMGLIKGG